MIAQLPVSCVRQHPFLTCLQSRIFWCAGVGGAAEAGQSAAQQAAVCL